MIRLILFFDLPKVILWVLLTIIYIISHFIFNHLIQNQLPDSTATIVTTFVSDNGKYQKLCLHLDCFNCFDLHKVIVWVLLFIIYIIYHLIFQTSD